jgi:hypothetical protein
MSFDFKTATPKALPSGALLFGADDQNAATPSVFEYTGGAGSLPSLVVASATLDNTGATDVTSGFETLCNANEAVWLDGDFRIDGTVTITSGVKITGPGRILHGPLGKILLQPAFGTPLTVSVMATESYPASNGSLCSKLTVSATTGLTQGTICSLYSDDTYDFDVTTTKKSELVKVLDISGSTVYLAGTVADTYTTNVKLAPLSTAKFVVDCRFSALTDPYAEVGNDYAYGVLQANGCISPELNPRMDSGYSAGIFVKSCWGAQVDAVVKNFRDKLSANMYGYGVVLFGASRNCEVRVQAERVRHAVTTGMWGAPSTIADYGVPRDNRIRDSRAIATTAAGFDTHPGAFNTVFEDCVHKDAGQDADGSGGQYWAFQSRGCNDTFQDCKHYGTGRIFSFDNSTTFGQDNVVRTINCYALKEPQYDSSNASPIRYVQKTSSDDWTHEDFGSNFESFGSDGSYSLTFDDAVGKVRYYGTHFGGMAQIHLATNNDVVMDGVVRKKNNRSFLEGIRLEDGTTLTIGTLHQIGLPASGRIVTAAGDGSARLYYGQITCSETGAVAYATPNTETINVTTRRITTLPEFSPTLETLPDITAWWDPSDLSTLFSDVDGTVPAVVDGNVVYMADKTGNGRYFVTDGAGPILRLSGGVYYLEFGGSVDMFTDAGVNTLLTKAEYDVYMAVRVNSGTNDATPYNNAAIWQDGDQYVGTFYKSSGTAQAYNYDNAPDFKEADVALTASTDVVLQSRLDSGFIRIAKDGGAFTSTATSDTQTQDSNVLLFKGASTHRITGRFYGGVMGKSALKSADRARMITFLGAKQGRTL